MNSQENLKPWGINEKNKWFSEQKIKRSYLNDVVTKIKTLNPTLKVISYGNLSYSSDQYPLFFITSPNFDNNKKTVLITGGVHGYETSGVHGALRFLETEALKYSEKFNVICFPCISPWGYETINRWNPLALDPNRCFFEDSPAEECMHFIKAIKSIDLKILAHIDLHETTDTDNSVFRPALASRDGRIEELSEIPDGFYLVGDSNNPQPLFQKAIIDSVRKVTHIAAADNQGRLIGAPVEQEGVINYDKKKLFLCGGVTEAQFITTTEVYPDSPKVNDDICVRAQVAAVKGALDYLLTL